MTARMSENEELIPEPLNAILIGLMLLGGVALVWGVFKVAEKESKK